MSRNLKVMGLAAVTVLAFGAVAASGAQAAEGFNWESGTARLTSSAIGIQEFTTTAGAIRCNEVHGEALVSGTSAPTTTAEKLSYTNNGSTSCPTSLGVNATIDTNGCHYTFHAGTTEGADKTKGTVDIVCPEATKSITVTAGLCTIHVPEQTGLGPVYYENNTAAGDVVVNPQVTNIHYTHEGFCGNGSGTTGKYTGNVTITGETSKGAATRIWVE